MLTVRIKVVGSPWRDLQLCSTEDLIGMQHHLVKHMLRLVQAQFFISYITEETL